jgi:hypothetical protein
LAQFFVFLVNLVSSFALAKNLVLSFAFN